MKIVKENNDKKGQFTALKDDVQAGLMTYTWAGDNKFIIDHTEVNPEFKGQGVGKKLVMAGVDYARENNVKIIPLCPYAASVFEKNIEIQDVLYKAE